MTILQKNGTFLEKNQDPGNFIFMFHFSEHIDQTSPLFSGEHSAQGKTKNWQCDGSSLHLGNKYVSFLIPFTDILINICFLSLLYLRLFYRLLNHEHLMVGDNENISDYLSKIKL